MTRTSNKRIALWIGILFVAAIVFYATGNGIIESATSQPDYLSVIPSLKTKLAIGALLMLLNSIVVAGIGALMLPVLNRYDPYSAYGYFGSRLIESVVLIVGLMGLLSLITIGQEYARSADPRFLSYGAIAVKSNFYAYQTAMIVLGLGSLLLCHVLYKHRLVPRLLAIWGFIGYILLAVGAALEVLGFPYGITCSILGGLFELALGLWLIFKGFNDKAFN